MVRQHSPPTNVAWAQFWHGALCGLSALLVLTLSQGFFSTYNYWTQSLVFLPLQKLTIQISIERGKGTCMKTSLDWCGFLYIVIYLFIYFIFWFMNCDTFILLYNYSSCISLIVINRMKKPATSWRRRNSRKILTQKWKRKWNNRERVRSKERIYFKKSLRPCRWPCDLSWMRKIKLQVAKHKCLHVTSIQNFGC